MRFSEYFVQVALLAEKGDVVEAERLLREAESYSLKSITNHAALCAKSWLWYLKNPDNAVRCLLEAECNNSDVRSLLEIAETYIELALHETACRRCIKKAILAATDEEDQMRIQEFFTKHSRYKKIENER
ncbi:MAG: hypothetical protein IJW31_03890 [Lentisphaeria bacterium]|nr:hypothetical protein [Lentisphaeria bacterium]